MFWVPGEQIHQARGAAESFGEDAERYHRSRPRYPEALYDRLIAAAPGPRFLDVGAGTGIVGAALVARGAQVTGVEVDPRMADFAVRQLGLEVEVARFEDWDPAGRRFDALACGTAWHWIDPAVGPERAAALLNPGGLIALFWNARDFRADIAESFALAYDRHTPGAPFARGMRAGSAASEPLLAAAADGLKRSGRFGAPERWSGTWSERVPPERWVDQLGTFGGHNRLSDEVFERLAAEMSAVIDAAGHSIEITYTTMAVIARRRAS